MSRIKEALVGLEYTDDEYLFKIEVGKEVPVESYGASVPPRPIPCDPSEEEPFVDAWNLFLPGILAQVIELNGAWLQWTSRSSSDVLSALFVNVFAAGMTDLDMFERISLALYAAGYTPSDQTLNATWTFPA